MHVRFLTPLAYVLFGLLVTASAQEAARKSEQKLVTRSYPVADLVVPFGSETPVVCLPGTPRKEPPACAEMCLPCPTSAPCPTAAAKDAAKPCCQESEPAKVTTLEDSLIKLITNTIRPQCWIDRGGSCTIDYYPLGMALVVSADPATHEQIDNLLQSLRKLQDQTVCLEIRVITAADGVFERLGYDLKPDGLERIGVDFRMAEDGKGVARHGPGNLRTVFLNEAEVKRLLSAIQGDARTNVTHSPKITVANGQTAQLMMTEERTFVTGVEKVRVGDQEMPIPKEESFPVGLTVTARPAVSADGRSVLVEMRTEWSSLCSPKPALVPVTTMITPVFEGGAQGRPIPFTQYIQQPSFNVQALHTKLHIPDGGTVLVGGLKRTREAEMECAHPVLARVPYVNRLFKTKAPGKEMETVVLMVTPRIVVCKEEIKPPVVSHPRPTATPLPAPVASQFAAPAPPVMDRHFKPAAWTAQQAVPPVKAAPLPAPAFRARQVSRLMEMYHEACAGGHHEEARKLAMFALELDPACFMKK